MVNKPTVQQLAFTYQYLYELAKICFIQEKYLIEDEILAEWFVVTISEVSDNNDNYSDSENNSDSSIIGNKQNKSLRLLLSDNEQTDSDDDTLDLTVYTWVKLHKT